MRHHQTSTPLSQRPRSFARGDLEPDNLVGGENGLWVAGWSSAVVQNPSGSVSPTADSEVLPSLWYRIDEERSKPILQVPAKVKLWTSLVQDSTDRYETVAKMSAVPDRAVDEVSLSGDHPEASQADRFDEFWSREEDWDPEVQRLRRRGVFLSMMFVALLPLTAFLAWQAGTGSQGEEESFAQQDDLAEDHDLSEDHDGASSAARSGSLTDDGFGPDGEGTAVDGPALVAEENSADGAPGGEDTSLLDRASGDRVDAAGQHSFEEEVFVTSDGVADGDGSVNSEFGTGHWDDALDLVEEGTDDREGTHAEDPPLGSTVLPDPKMSSEPDPQLLPYPQPEPPPVDPEPTPDLEPAPLIIPVVGPAAGDFPNPISCTSSSRSVFWFIKTDGSQYGDGRNVYRCPTVVLEQPAAETGGGLFHLKFERCWADRIDVDFGADGSIDWTVRGSAGVCSNASTPNSAGLSDGSAIVAITATGSEGQQAAYWVAGYRS